MKIKSIQATGNKQTVNLTVENELHNYILANGMVSKNSHSVAYSYITYATAYLKAHYAAEFYTALLTVKSMVLDDEDDENGNENSEVTAGP